MNFNIDAYREQMERFPEITFEEFQAITDLEIRKDIVMKNKIISTDAYNRTMMMLKWRKKSSQREVYTLTFRKSPNWVYNVVYWIRNLIKKILWRKFTQAELDFAAKAYDDQKEKWANSFFDKEVWQEVIDNWGYLPLQIRAVKDWTVLKPGEPVMSIAWPWELAAHFEADLIKVFFQSVVATDMNYIEDIIGEWRAVEFGKRAAINDEAHIDAVEALYVGGWLTWTSNDRAAIAVPQLRASWTTAHRYLACYKTEDEAFRNAIEKADKIWLLVDLVDSYRWIDKIVELKKEYREKGKIIWMRLDSWNLVDQAIYALNKQKENWLLDPAKDKIVVADISDVDQIKEIEEKVLAAWFNPKDYIVYGLGWLLVAKNKLRDIMSAVLKLTLTEEFATWKLSNDAGKEATPWELNVEIREDWRYIVQEDEEILWERLLKLVYDNWKMFFNWNDVEALEMAKKLVKESKKLLNLPTKKSEKTQRLCKEVKERFQKVV